MLAGQLIHDVYIHSLSDSCNNYNLHFVYKQSKLTSLTNKLSIYYYSIGSVITFCIFVINCEQSLQTVILSEASPLRSLQKNLNGLAQFYFILDAVLEFFKYFQNSYFVEYLCIHVVSLPVDFGHALIPERKYFLVFNCYFCGAFIVVFEQTQYNMQHINRFYVSLPPENLRCSDVFSRYGNVTLKRNGTRKCFYF